MSDKPTDWADVAVEDLLNLLSRPSIIQAILDDEDEIVEEIKETMANIIRTSLTAS